MAETEFLSIRAKVSEGGRIVIPAEFRKAMGLEVGDDVIVRLDRGEIKITGVADAVQLIQEKVRRYVPEGRSLSEELIAQRRQESSHE